jgi:hypothetical protein
MPTELVRVGTHGAAPPASSSRTRASHAGRCGLSGWVRKQTCRRSSSARSTWPCSSSQSDRTSRAESSAGLACSAASSADSVYIFLPA